MDIAKKIANAGGRLYLVGGALRDEILGRKISDKDYCVVGLIKEQFIDLFPEANLRGKDFEVFDINGAEYALARKERKTGIGHKEFEIETGAQITIEEDLLRRDITINSMAKDVLTGEIIDPFGGKQDLQNKVIRATSEHFKEDPLRVYRVARFSSMLGFEIDGQTLEQMHSLREELPKLSKERVFVEFRKALKTEKPSLFFNALRKAEVLDVHFKEIYDLIGQTQPEKYHPEGDSYNHTMLAVDKSAELTDRIEVRYSALVHDLGKGLTPKEMLPHHYGHDKNGVELVGNLSNRIGVPVLWKKCGKIAAEEHMRASIFDKMKPAKQVELMEKLDKSLLGLDGMMIVVKADKCSSRSCEELVDFASLGKKVLETVNGEKIVKEYPTLQGEAIGKMLIEERINFLKNCQKSIDKQK